jgi:hypothetical protein
MDCRVKPGNDDLKLAPMGLDPGLGPRIHVFVRCQDVDGRVNPRIKSGGGHDEFDLMRHGMVAFQREV